jgi:hypothetical protein
MCHTQIYIYMWFHTTVTSVDHQLRSHSPSVLTSLDSILFASHRVLRLAQRRHDIDTIGLASELLNRWVLVEVSTTHHSVSSSKVATYIKSHKNVVFLPRTRQLPFP